MNKKDPEKLSDCTVSLINPFIEGLSDIQEIEPRKKNIAKDTPLYSPSSGEEHTVRILTGDSEYFWHDGRIYSKVYTGSIGVLKGLSSAGIQMFLYILENLTTNRDIVYLKPSEYLKYANVTSRSQYYSAAFELVMKKIIAKTPSSGAFYVNPAIVYNGSITNLLPDAYKAYGDRELTKQNKTVHRKAKENHES